MHYIWNFTKILSRGFSMTHSVKHFGWCEFLIILELTTAEAAYSGIWAIKNKSLISKWLNFIVALLDQLDLWVGTQVTKIHSNFIRTMGCESILSALWFSQPFFCKCFHTESCFCHVNSYLNNFATNNIFIIILLIIYLFFPCKF